MAGAMYTWYTASRDYGVQLQIPEMKDGAHKHSTLQAARRMSTK